MKRNNMIFKLAAVLVVLAAIAFVVANPFKQPAPDATGAVAVGEQSASGMLLVDAKRDAVTAISITPPAQPEFRLTKDGANWYAVQGEKRYPADSGRVEQLLEALPELRAESLVSERGESYKDLGVGEDAAIKVRVFTNGDTPVAELLVGNAAPGFAGSFVRRADGIEVYKSAANIKSLVGFSYRDYRSKKPWSLDPQAVTKLSVRPVAGTPVEFTKQDGVWKGPGGGNANQNLLTTLLNDWSQAQVSDFADDVTPGETPFDPSIEGADPAGTAGKDAAGKDLPAKFKLGTEPNLIAETPAGKFSLTVGVKDAALYYVGDQAGLVYRMGEPDLSFFRELKHDQLLIGTEPDPVAATDGVETPAEDTAGLETATE